MSDPTLIAAGGKRSRRSWSDEEKRRIVAEAVLPGASVADIARRHGVNANLVFNWRKTARAVLSVAEPNASPVALPVNPSSRAAEHGEFIPIGVIGQAEDAAAISMSLRASSACRSAANLEFVAGDAVSDEVKSALASVLYAVTGALVADRTMAEQGGGSAHLGGDEDNDDDGASPRTQ